MSTCALGEPSRAVQEYERVVQVRPKDAAVQFGLGVALAGAKRAEAATRLPLSKGPHDSHPRIRSRCRMLSRVEVRAQALPRSARRPWIVPSRSRRSRLRCRWTAPACFWPAATRRVPSRQRKRSSRRTRAMLALTDVSAICSSRPATSRARARPTRRSLELSQTDAQILNNAAWLEVDAKGDLDEGACVGQACHGTAAQGGRLLRHARVRSRGHEGICRKPRQRSIRLLRSPRDQRSFHYRLGIVQSEQGAAAKAVESLEQALAIGLVRQYADDAKQRLATLKK